MINNPKIIQEFLERVKSIPAEDIKKAVDEVLKEEKDKQFELLRSNIPIQEVKDLKDRILKNKEYTVVLEGDKEFPDNATEATFEKYINLKVLDELVERK